MATKMENRSKLKDSINNVIGSKKKLGQAKTKLKTIQLEDNFFDD